jgi:hypothetical protein
MQLYVRYVIREQLLLTLYRLKKRPCIFSSLHFAYGGYFIINFINLYFQNKV